MNERLDQAQANDRETAFGGKRQLGGALIGLLLLIALAALAIYLERPPRVAPEGSPPGEFSSARAMTHLNVIAASPRPIGSAANAAAREYILKELAALGLNGEVQAATSTVFRPWGHYVAGTVNNVVARLSGTQNSKAVLLLCHYDSVPNGPGASDDGSGVAVLLETLRALKSSPPLKNDVIFLFSDGEEEGLLGARAFVEKHPMAKDVGLALNFEARGVGGPSIMFETSDGNGWLVDEFAEAAPHPVANSLTNEIYKLMPNDTDLSAFKRAGIAGLNFAFIEGSVQYHTELDNLQNISRQSLQHHGSYALALTKKFGDQDLTDTKRADAVYFALLGSQVVRYPAWAAKALALLLTLLFGFILVYGLRRRQLSVRGIAYGFFGFLLSQVIVLLVVGVIWRIILALQSEGALIESGIAYGSNFYILGLVASELAIMLMLYSLLRRKAAVTDLVTGALLLWVSLTLATSFLLPGASFLFAWPSLFSVLALGFVLLKQVQPGSPRESVILFAGVAPAVILLAPLIYLIFVALTLRTYAAIIIAAGLLLGLVVPQLSVPGRSGRWLQPALPAALSLAFIIAGISTSDYNQDQRKPNSVLYGLDADLGKAVWFSSNQEADEYTSQFFSGGLERGNNLDYFFSFTRTVLKSDAPVATLTPPDIALVSSEQSEGVRALRLRIKSTRSAPCIWVAVHDQAELINVAVNDAKLERHKTAPGVDRSGPLRMEYYGVGENGIELSLQTKSDAPVRIDVMDRSYGSTDLPGVPIQPRPNYMMAAGYPNSDSILVKKSYTF